MYEQQAAAVGTNWWISDGDRPTGPHSESMVLAGVKRGRISPVSYACPLGGQEWKMVCEWPAFVRACAAVGTVAHSPEVVVTRAAVGGRQTVHQKSWSGLALSSLILAAVGFFGYLMAVIVAAVGSTNGAAEDQPIVIVAGLMVVALLAANFFGALLGVIALTQNVGHKWMAVVGLLGNGLEILGLIGLIVLGALAS